VFPKLEVRHFRAVIALAEELNFTRAAHRLHMTQPGLSRQITELEEGLRFRLFSRDKRRVVELTDAGRVFVEEARSALLHTERAVHLAHAVHGGSDTVLMIGHSPCTEHSWISGLLTIRLPLYPKLRIRLRSHFPVELVRSVLAGELSLALVTAPPEDAQITAVPFARAPLYAALPEHHPAAHKERVALRDLAEDQWILFAKQVHPIVHDTILETARRETIVPKDAHDIFTGQQAVHLVSEHLGVAIVTKHTALGFHSDRVVVKPLSDKSLWFESCLIMRADDDSRAANEFARSFLRKCMAQCPAATQMELPLPA
jgi:DNA-binding transcriptional LysR family regulator